MGAVDKPKDAHWVGDVPADTPLTERLQQLCDAFNQSAFCALLGVNMVLEDGQIQARIDMRPELIGNAAYQILHGGVAASVLDSIGGISAMAELYRRNDDDLTEQLRKVARLATIDMRIDYLRPGRGQHFVATAQVLRMGRKGCTMRMDMIDQDGALIATGIAAYAY